MTTNETPRVPGSRPGHSAVQRLITLDPDVFAEQVWARKHLLSRAADLGSGGFADLLSPDAVDELVSTRGLRSPFLRVAKEGDTLPDRAFTAPGGVGAGIGDQVSDDKLLQLIADGATMVLQGLHRIWPPLINFSQQLATDLGHPVQVNAYITPPQNKGFSDHYDVHDVFVLQVEGEKQWMLHEPVFPSPLRDQPWGQRRAAVEAAAQQEPLLDTILRPGDCLYLPRGYLHAAKALGGVSTHITIGVHTWTRHHLAEQLLSSALQQVKSDPNIRASLPYGRPFATAAAHTHGAGDQSDGNDGPNDQGTHHQRTPDQDEATNSDVELVRRTLIEAVQSADSAVILAALRADARDAQRAGPIGPLRQLETANQLRHEDSLMIRPHLAGMIDTDRDGSPCLVSRAGEIRLTSAEAPLVSRLLDGSALTGAELGIDFARRLLINGVIIAGRDRDPLE